MAALNSPGETIIKSKRCRDHTEKLFNYLKIPIKIKKEKNYDLIKIKGLKNFKSFNYNIPADPSSSAFFAMLTILSKNSSILIKNCLINENRIGFYKTLERMGANIIFKNKKSYKGEKIADIFCKSTKNLKSINLSKNFENSSAIDEFNSIFIIASFSQGVSAFKGLEELNKKVDVLLKKFNEQKGIIDGYVKRERDWKKNKTLNLKKIKDLEFELKKIASENNG